MELRAAPDRVLSTQLHREFDPSRRDPGTRTQHRKRIVRSAIMASAAVQAHSVATASAVVKAHSVATASAAVKAHSLIAASAAAVNAPMIIAASAAVVKTHRL